jgi:hypothetical protein
MREDKYRGVCLFVGFLPRDMRDRGDTTLLFAIHVSFFTIWSLRWCLVETELAELFSCCGEVHRAKVMVDKKTKASKGFGFVNMDEKKALLGEAA